MTTISENTKETSAYLVGFEQEETGPILCRELLIELADLADTLGLSVVGQEIAKQREVTPRYLIGTGKAREIVEHAKESGAQVIIFDDFLSPAQQRNWETLSGLAVIDRQELILEIFSEHARTNEAVLQIQLAKATYALPRLHRKWTHLNRERGMAGGLGLRGGGEQQLELDARVIRRRIAWLKAQLAEMRQHREVQRALRTHNEIPTAAIVGYTNAGKSTLLNAMTDAQVMVADKLFATLDPTVRKYTLPGGQEILLADTVGFIRKLPHLLVESFQSTLEEAARAHYIIEILDASSTSLKDQHETTQKVLAEIGAVAHKTILVLNKIDLLPPDSVERLRCLYPKAILCSATTGIGLERLAERLEAALNDTAREQNRVFTAENMAELTQLRKRSCILEEKWEEDGLHVRFKNRLE